MHPSQATCCTSIKAWQPTCQTRMKMLSVLTQMTSPISPTSRLTATRTIISSCRNRSITILTCIHNCTRWGRRRFHLRSRRPDTAPSRTISLFSPISISPPSSKRYQTRPVAKISLERRTRMTTVRRQPH